MNICAIFTGGTIGSQINDDGYISPEQNNAYRLLEMYREKHGSIHSFTWREPYYILSENLDGVNLSRLIKAVGEALDCGKFDGILVMHGTDTLSYSAAALGLLYDLSDIPIVMVSSNFPLEDERANGFVNFERAIDFTEWALKNNTGGVFVSYRNLDGVSRIHKGQYILQQSLMSSDVYSVENNYFGKFDDKAFCPNPDFTEDYLVNTIAALRCNLTKNNGEENGNFFCISGLSPVMRLPAYVGMTYPVFLKDNIKKVLITAYHSGTIAINDELATFSNMCVNRGIDIYLTGLSGKEAMYETVEAYEKLGIKPLCNMTDITAYMFLWFTTEID